LADSRASFENFNDFYHRWREEEGFESNGFGVCWFPAAILYASKAKTVVEVARVTIHLASGPGDGRIAIEETGQLTAEIFHLDFKADFQDYRHDPCSGSLVVSGYSQKMGGRYSVKISPKLPRP
jgi:hypothetical protein